MRPGHAGGSEAHLRTGWQYIVAAALVGCALASGARADSPNLWNANANARPGATMGKAAAPSGYREICTRARAVLHRESSDSPDQSYLADLAGSPDLAGVLPEIVRSLREATRQVPDGADAWALLGESLVRLDSRVSGDVPPDRDEALSALLRAQRLGTDSAYHSMALALALAQSGDLEPSLFLYRRLVRNRHTPLLLRRTADVLMALGRLDESLPLYREACGGSITEAQRVRGAGYPIRLEAGRACYALAAALDRSERLSSVPGAMRQAVALDPTQRSFGLGSDFVPAVDRAYYRSLVFARQGDSCQELAALRAYLDPDKVPVYAARAKSRLLRLVPLALLCKGEYSFRLKPKAERSIDVPLGSQPDRDGGAPWPVRVDAGSKSPT